MTRPVILVVGRRILPAVFTPCAQSHYKRNDKRGFPGPKLQSGAAKLCGPSKLSERCERQIVRGAVGRAQFNVQRAKD